MKKAILLGIMASFFFAFTFVLNQQMNFHGGSWIWSASLRYIFTLPILFLIMVAKCELKEVIQDIVKHPARWTIWSTVGFGMFYAPLSFASIYGQSWLVAGTWQITIIAGGLLSPVFFKEVNLGNRVVKVRNKIPKKVISVSLIILSGIFLMQFQQIRQLSSMKPVIGIIPVIVAAFSYPLGNRKMIEACGGKFNTFQRVFGMTLCSMPFWVVLSVFGIGYVGLPSKGQAIQSFIVAVCSGVVATVLFFRATDIVSSSQKKLAAVECTQSGEVIFTLLGGVLFFNDKIPTKLDLIGITFIVVGMILNSCTAEKTEDNFTQQLPNTGH